jgi:DNA-binding transcriptional LysR family regulator
LSYGLQELMPALLDFAQAQPFIELIMDLSDQRSNLIEEGLDLSIRITADLQPGDIVRKLGECRLLTLASPGYIAQHGEPRHPGDLRHHECLIYASDNAVSTWAYRDRQQPLSVQVRGRIVANNGVALTEAAARGMGITRQPDFIAAPYLARGEVQALLQAFENAPLGIYAVLPSNRYIPHRVSALIEHLARVLETPRPLSP